MAIAKGGRNTGGEGVELAEELEDTGAKAQVGDTGKGADNLKLCVSGFLTKCLKMC